MRLGAKRVFRVTCDGLGATVEVTPELDSDPDNPPARMTRIIRLIDASLELPETSCWDTRAAKELNDRVCKLVDAFAGMNYAQWLSGDHFPEVEGIQYSKVLP